MIVIFISLSVKKAKQKTNQVLDLYADRIGQSTWKTNITKEGLKVVKEHLSKTASKNTSVSCHWFHKNKNTEILWIVGSRTRFTNEGIVPIATTKNNILHNEWEENDKYLPLIQALVAIATLFHDVGKASDAFQKMLQSKKSSDVIRHEYISMLIFLSFTINEEDKEWLNNFSSNRFLKLLKEKSEYLKKKGVSFLNNSEKQSNLKLVISYLILTHHKLPIIFNKKIIEEDYCGENLESLQDLFSLISKEWGYNKKIDEEYDNKFSKGIVFSEKWIKEVKKWSLRLLNNLDSFYAIDNTEVLFLILKRARLYINLGDYYFSSKDKDEKYQCGLKLYANTYLDKDGKSKNKQFLEEHLLGVEKEALQSIYSIKKSVKEFPILSNIKALNKKSIKGSKFFWQDKVSSSLKRIKNEDKREDGFFCVNLASTGTGKTFANARIMTNIMADEEEIRFNVALGLRSLTLQTGDMYRNKMHIDNTDLAVVIGSSAIESLHKLNDEEQPFGRSVFDEIDYANIIPPSALNNVIRFDKEKKFLCAPVCVSTVDHLIPATESVIGGQWIIPFLRLATSDLIIDEIDDFVGSDLMALAHLVYISGMLGRRVLISSATITPSIAQGFYKAYKKGWQIHNKYYCKKNKIITCFTDEFSYLINENDITDSKSDSDLFVMKYNKFSNKRIQEIINTEKKNGVKRKGEILKFKKEITREELFDLMIEKTIKLHHDNSITDKITKKQISFGLIRFAHTKNVIAFSNYLNEKVIDTCDVHFLCYHSRNMLLVRNKIENYLDQVLFRSGQDSNVVDFDNTIVRNHIDNSKTNNVIFIVVATPVEEVGRDHDFDWAIVEPSSIRSIIQLAGRVLRHREKHVTNPNISILEYNLNSLVNDNIAVFKQPGYELNNEKEKLNTHDLINLLDEKQLSESINSKLRLTIAKPLEPKDNLIDLEHYSIMKTLLKEGMGPENLEGYYAQYWSLTGFPQILAPFRENIHNKKIYCFYDDNDNFSFYERDKNNKFIKVQNTYNIKFVENKKNIKDWINLDMINLVEDYSEKLNLEIKKIEWTYCFVEIPNYLLVNGKELNYSVELGI